MKIHRMSGSRRVSSLAGLAALALLALGSLPGPVLAADSDAADSRAACNALAKPLGESVTGLPVEGASVESATQVEAGTTIICKVTAGIGAKEGGAAPLRFELDLPAKNWNLRGVQFAAGLDAPPPAIDPARAVAAGFAVFGALGARDIAAGSDEAGLSAQKKIRDVAADLLARRFNRFTDKFYLVSDQQGAEQALAIAARYPRAYRGMLVDASGAKGASGAATAAASNDGAAQRPVDYSAAIAPYAANGGKLLILAPAAESVADSLAIVKFQRDQLAKKGRRYADDFVRLFTLPDAVAAGSTIDWLPVLVDWAENMKAPAALPDLSKR